MIYQWNGLFYIRFETANLQFLIYILQYKNFILDGECDDSCPNLTQCNVCMRTLSNEARTKDMNEKVTCDVTKLSRKLEKRMVSVFKIFAIKNRIKFYRKMYMKFQISVYFSLHNTLEY